MAVVRSLCCASQALPARSFSTCAAHRGSSNGGDYVHESVLPMHHFQRSLPRLPIPKLEETCARYLSAQQPLLTDAEYKLHAVVTKEFQEGVGIDLHKVLKSFDSTHNHTSYITGHWFDMYLESRDPLPLNYNPFICFTDDTNPGGDDQIVRAATLVSSAMRFLRSYRDGKLSPELYHLNPKKTDNDAIKKRLSYFPEIVSWYGAYLHKVFPLDMSQYGNLFNSTRVPHKHKDEIVTQPGRRHIAVLSKGNFYTFDVLNEDGTAVDVSTIYACLREIERKGDAENSQSVACLTTQERNEWAAARIQLITDQKNAENLELIDSAVFMLCLEDSEPKDVISLSNTFLHGQAHTRWFDKSLQLIVCRGGKAAVNFEHSWGDGVAVLRFLTEVYEDVKKRPFTLPVSTPTAPVTTLSFNVDDSVKAAISAATERFDKHTSSLAMDVVQYPGMDRSFVKKHKISADAVLQFSLQLAFYRQYGYTPATYESCSTAAFKHGRTETVRPATTEAAACVEAFLRKEPASKAELRDLLEKVSKKHSQLIREAATGKGFDRHLFALKRFAENLRENVDLFESAPYKNINHIELSTSTLTSPAVQLGGFAPVVENGLGVGYRVDNDGIASQVTAYNGHKNPSDFVNALHTSLQDIQGLFEE